jgi:pimeloyl-ACP methyl ester carboxylesterase
VGLTACTAGSTESSDPTDGTAPGATGVQPTSVAPPAPFTGSDEEFYEVPDPLEADEPGALIRVQPIPGEPDAPARSYKVMYHSRDAIDRDRAVTGIITVPTGAAPEGGWPVIAWAHGTTGLASVCAPSRSESTAPTFGIEGIGVATDYIGLGPVGERHAYLSGASEAHSVVDAVRAAHGLVGEAAGEQWLAIGHSQGGHAALFTNELGAAYAPELDILGTVSVAPAAVLERTFGPEDQVVPRMVGIMALYGIATDHPELEPDDYLSEQAAAHEHVIDEGCTNEIVGEMLQVPAEVLYDHDPIETEPARSIVAENDPGHVAVDVPLLVVQGTADTWVVPARTEVLMAQLCSVGQVVELLEIPDATHDSVVAQATPGITAWFSDRLSGDEPVDGCPSG